ncbi:MAG: Pectinesterase [Bacteroidetes bacterium]|nr:Pectinesterase [Bacteroidota bacterium]
MKKIYLIAGATLLSVATFAQTGSKAGKAHVNGTKPFVHASSVERAGNDTTGIVNVIDFLPEFLPGGGAASIYGYTGGGYIYGNNVDGLNVCAQGYANLNATPVHIVGALIWFAAMESDAGSSATSKLKINTYNLAANKAYNTDNSGTFNSTVLNAEGPSGVAVSTADLLFSNIDTMPGEWNYVPLSVVATFTGDFAIGVDATSLAAGDTVGIVSDNQNDAANIDLAFHKYGTKWYVTDALFSDPASPTFGTGGLDNDIAIWAVISDATGVTEFYNGMKLTTYPNPTVDKATVEYTLEKGSNNVTLVVYDQVGRKIANNTYGHQDAGTYKVDIDASNLASGNYFYQLTANGHMFTKKFVVSK